MAAWMSMLVVLGYLFSAMGSFSPSSLQSSLDHAIAVGSAQFVIPPGKYEMGDLDLVVANANQFQLIAVDVWLIFAPGHGMNVVNCTDTLVSGVSIDFSPAAFSQGTVLGLPETNTVIMDIEEGFLPPDPQLNPYFQWHSEVKMIFWDPLTRVKVRPQPMSAPCFNSTRTASGQYKINVTLGDYQPRVGDLVTVSMRYRSLDYGALPTYYTGIYNVFSSHQVRSQDLQIYGGAAMGVLEWGGTGGHTYSNITVSRHPNPSYPPRLLSCNLDGFHSFAVGSGPLLEASRFEFMGDDFLNVHNRLLFTLNASLAAPLRLHLVDPSDVLLCRNSDCTPMHTGSEIRPGDSLGLYQLSDLSLQNTVTVASVRETQDPALVSAARALPTLLAGSPYHQRYQTILSSAVKVYEVTLTSPGLTPSLQPYTYVQFDRCSSAHAIIRNNYFHDSYDSCARAQGSNLIIQNNTYSGASAGMSVVVDPFWLEGSLGLHDIAIVGNTFQNVTHCENQSSCFTIGSTTRNIRIEDNHFHSHPPSESLQPG